MIPLQYTPHYSADAYPSYYYSRPRNTTEWNLFMTELVNGGNEISKLLLQNLPSTLPGAHIGEYGLDIREQSFNFLPIVRRRAV